MWSQPTLLVLTALTLGMETISSPIWWPMWQPMKSTSFCDTTRLISSSLGNRLSATITSAAVLRLLHTLLIWNLYLTETLGLSAISRNTGDARYTLGVELTGCPS